MPRPAQATPEWMGWLALGLLVAVFAAALWWLFFSHLPRPVPPSPPTARAARYRQALAVLILLSGSALAAGARWDELWHRLYGGFGEDFLWPPHLLMYASLGLNAVFAGVGLGLALRGQGGLRERFRREPLMGLLGLLATYQMASIPSDLLWHEIIGADISAWSLPHFLLAVTISGAMLTGVAIALSTVRRGAWRGLWQRPAAMELVALGIVGLATLYLLQFGTTEWEWARGDVRARVALMQRPLWAYPVAALLIGIGSALLALYATRRIGAATFVALGVLLVQLAALAVYRRAAPPGPVLAAHLLLLPPALALDVWHWQHREQAGAPATLWGGIAVYAAVYFAVAFPFLARALPFLTFTLPRYVTTALIGLVAALVVGPAVARAAAWLAQVGHPRSTPLT